MAKKAMRVAAHRFIQHGVAFFQFSLTTQLLNYLENRPQIKRYEPGKNGLEMHGYQREQDDGKVEQIAKYVADPNNALVDPININLPIESGELEFEPISSAHPNLGYLVIPADAVLNIYDGGHRELGADRAWNRSADIDFDLPATLANRPEQDEILLFAIKNITVDRIASDLLVDLKVKLNGSLNEVNGEKRYLPTKMTKDMSWLANAREIARILQESKAGQFAGNVWYRKMRYANQKGEKLPNAQQWFKLGKFAEYLRYVAMNSFKLLPESIEDRAVLVSNMWQALKTLVPDAFSVNAPNYRLATGHVSIEPLHRLVNSFMLYHLCEGKFGNYATFQEAADAVGGVNVIPTVDEFIEILKKCRVRPADNPSSRGRLLFTAAHWMLNGPSRHYHGKGNVSILINEVNESLDIPPMTNPPTERAA